MRSVAFLLFFIVGLFTIYVVTPLYYIFSLFSKRLASYFRCVAPTVWAKSIFMMVGAPVTVEGRENLPAHNRICFVANHESYADIPLVFIATRRSPGFIARKGLEKVPVVGLWMYILKCVLIDRKSLRQGKLAIEKGAEQIKKGTPMVIFPEGTRSKSYKMRPFKGGSFKLAFLSDATIVPLSIVGSFKLYEEYGAVRSHPVKVVIHKPIEIKSLSQEERITLPEKVQEIIASALPDA
ncbi:lysophospholipid acyltransferase family protein [Spirochaetia bacterium 38H-sp]|uniref:Lysophospholipid acyltransferase family protein n=1 Tax=Rarispira pelagica TaxID=3141764 RepID=A0ABU9UC95_9SPIR